MLMEDGYWFWICFVIFVKCFDIFGVLLYVWFWYNFKGKLFLIRIFFIVKVIKLFVCEWILKRFNIFLWILKLLLIYLIYIINCFLYVIFIVLFVIIENYFVCFILLSIDFKIFSLFREICLFIIFGEIYFFFLIYDKIVGLFLVCNLSSWVRWFLDLLCFLIVSFCCNRNFKEDNW